MRQADAEKHLNNIAQALSGAAVQDLLSVDKGVDKSEVGNL